MDVLGTVEVWERQRPMRDVIQKVEDDLLLRHRWLVAVGAILIQVSLGAIYAWGVFTAKLTDPSGPYKFTATQTQWVFSVGLAVFAVVMVLGGRLQAIVGPRPIAIMGGLLLGTGYGLAGLFADSFVLQLLLIGLVGGAGIGLAYVVPIAVGMRWFPDKKGLMTGLAVAGFGFGALLWVQMAGSWGRLLDRVGVQTTFLIYSFMFGGLVHLGGLLMAYPPDGWRPAGWTPPAKSARGGGPAHAKELRPMAMLGTAQFYFIWLAFVFSALAGLMLIGINKLYGRDALVASGEYSDLGAAGDAASMAYALAFAVANGLGRIGWGWIADRLGWKRSLAAMTAAQGVLMVAFYFFAGNLLGLYVLLALTGLNFGGNFALFPLATAETFGARNVGLNYGWIFTAYGVGGIAGPVMAGLFKDAAGGAVSAWMPPFMIAGGLCIVAALLALAVRPLVAPRPGLAEGAR